VKRERIESFRNPLIQQIRRLQTSAQYRREQGKFTGDGTKLFAEAAKWWPGLETVLVSEGTEICPLPENVRVAEVPESLMARVSAMEAPQGAIFVCAMPTAAPLRLTGPSLILDGIQDPGNLGTILRTADALEIPAVLTEGCADPYGPKTVRASMGAVFRAVPQTAPREQVIAACRAQGVRLLATAMDESAQDIREAPLRGAAVVIGSEGRGVSREFLEAAEGKIVIPMNGRCESMNAAIAAAIVLWQMKTI
jgi:TrmH family RNA methyltransferase